MTTRLSGPERTAVRCYIKQAPEARLTRAMQRTVQTVTQIAFSIWPPVRPAADRRRYVPMEN